MAENRQNNAEPQQDYSELVRVRREKLAQLKAAGKDPFVITKYDVTDKAKDIVDNFVDKEEGDETPGKMVSIAGRIMTKRGMGKAGFADLRDDSGRIQLYVRKDMLGDESYAEFKKLDIGDIVGVKGEVFRTHMGEISVKAHEVVLLSKSLLPLPDKWSGLKDQDTRYRQRYLDLIVNPNVRDTFIKRSRILKEIRAYLDSKGFLEVDTPVLTPCEIGAAARPFITHHNALDMDLYLRIETELYLKRLVVGGMERVYEVGRIFRNEGMDTKHNPEFTSIELYQAYTDYKGMMALVEELNTMLAEKICGSTKITYQGTEIDMGKWERLTMVESVKKYAGVDYNEWKTDEDARACAKQHNVEVPDNATKGTVLIEFFDAYVEEKLIQPTIIYDYPVENSTLAKRKPENPAFTERFEYFIYAREMGNAFSELNDPIDQKQRFVDQVEAKRAEEPDTKAEVDEDYVTALEYGLAPTGGLGFGIDRLVMLLTDSASIRDVLLFPTMKPLDTPKSEKKPEEVGIIGGAKGTVEIEIKDEPIDFSHVKIEPIFEEMVDFETFAKSDFRAVKILACEAVPKSKKLLKFTLDDGVRKDRVILSGIHEYYEPEQLVGKTAIAIVNLPPRKMMGIASEGMLISAVHEEDGHEGLNLLMVDDRIPAGAKLY